MTDKELLKTFRLGNRKALDKLTGKTYVANGNLADKVRYIRRFTIGNLILPPAFFFLSPQEASQKLFISILLFIFTFFEIFMLGRFLVKKDDLKNVVGE